MRTGLFLILAAGARPRRHAPRPGAGRDQERPAGVRHVARLAPPEVRRLDRHPRHARRVRVFSSIWFKGIIVLLVTSVLACSVNRAPHLWKLTVHPRTDMSARLLRPRAADTATPSVRPSRQPRPPRSQGAQGAPLPDDRHRGAAHGPRLRRPLPLGPVRDGHRPPQPRGHPRRASSSARTSASATRASPSPSARRCRSATGPASRSRRRASPTPTTRTTAAPSDYASDLVVYKDGQQVAAATIRVNEPLRFGDVTFYQSFFGAAAAHEGRRRHRQGHLEQGVPLEWTPTTGPARSARSRSRTGLTMLRPRRSLGEVDPDIKAGPDAGRGLQGRGPRAYRSPPRS